MKLSGIKICVDFDGTIVDNFDRPDRKTLPNAFEVMKKLQGEGAYLVLWTLREGARLHEAIAFCDHNDFKFNSVNEIPLELDYRKSNKEIRRKPDAHHFIDDRNVGGFPGWDFVEKALIK